MKKNDFTPLVMWVSLLLGIILIAYIRSGRTSGLWNDYPLNFDNLFIGAYILWMLLELRVSQRDVSTEGKRTADSVTCQLYGCGQALTFLTALWFPSAWRVPNFAHFAGITMFLFGAGYRAWAIHALGHFYSHRVRMVAEHRIVASGPYRFTRHPAYAGMLIANAGICVYFPNWVTLCVLLLILVPAMLLRIVIEERTLFRIEGYAEFAGKRKRLLPAIW